MSEKKLLQFVLLDVYLCKFFRVKTQPVPLFVLKKRSEEKNSFHGGFVTNVTMLRR